MALSRQSYNTLVKLAKLHDNANTELFAKIAANVPYSVGVQLSPRSQQLLESMEKQAVIGRALKALTSPISRMIKRHGKNVFNRPAGGFGKKVPNTASNINTNPVPRSRAVVKSQPQGRGVVRTAPRAAGGGPQIIDIPGRAPRRVNPLMKGMILGGAGVHGAHSAFGNNTTKAEAPMQELPPLPPMESPEYYYNVIQGMRGY